MTKHRIGVRFSRDKYCGAPSEQYKAVRQHVMDLAESASAQLGVALPEVRLLECSKLQGDPDNRRGGFSPISNTIYLNMSVLPNGHAYEKTFAHEMAHAIAYNKTGHREDRHGPTWKSVMQAMLQDIPARYL